VANRGYNQEGLSFESGSSWEGYFFARTSGGPVELRVALQDYFAPPRVLAQTTLTFAGGNWSQLKFKLTPNASTACRGFPADTPPLWCKLGADSGKGDSGHACIQCSGQLAISLLTPSTVVDLDYAYLQPGPWGRYKDLPLNLDAVQWLQKGGYNLIRTGGTYVEADSDEDGDGTRDGYLWKKLRGPAWLRPGGQVENHDGMNGVMTTKGWSMFEAIEMCEAMDITAVITLKSTESYSDLGDLVEYLYAAATTAAPGAGSVPPMGIRRPTTCPGSRSATRSTPKTSPAARWRWRSAPTRSGKAVSCASLAQPTAGTRRSSMRASLGRLRSATGCMWTCTTVV
jgi:hypothetical protein